MTFRSIWLSTVIVDGGSVSTDVEQLGCQAAVWTASQRTHGSFPPRHSLYCHFGRYKGKFALMRWRHFKTGDVNEEW